MSSSASLGATVEMTGPHGFFQLVEQHAGDVVFAATGTGLAANCDAPPAKRMIWNVSRSSTLWKNCSSPSTTTR